MCNQLTNHKCFNLNFLLRKCRQLIQHSEQINTSNYNSLGNLQASSHLRLGSIANHVGIHRCETVGSVAQYFGMVIQCAVKYYSTELLWISLHCFSRLPIIDYILLSEHLPSLSQCTMAVQFSFQFKQLATTELIIT